jgi:hypothetical protein
MQVHDRWRLKGAAVPGGLSGTAAPEALAGDARPAGSEGTIGLVLVGYQGPLQDHGNGRARGDNSA